MSDGLVVPDRHSPERFFEANRGKPASQVIMRAYVQPLLDGCATRTNRDRIATGISGRFCFRLAFRYGRLKLFRDN